MKQKVEDSKERLAINLEMRKSSDLDPDEWRVAWRFYGKMINHLFAILLTICVTVASFYVVISIHVKNYNAKNDYQTNP